MCQLINQSMSLRSFLDNCEDENILSKEVDIEFDVPALITKDQSKPIIFENVDGFDKGQIVSNLVSSRKLIGNSLGVQESEIINKISDSLENPSEPSKGEPSFSKVTEKPDLKEEIPIPVFYDRKNRRYFASSIVVARDPETGVQNLSFHRMMYNGDNELVMRMVKRHLYDIYEKSDNELDIAIVMGVHPAVEIAAATSYSPELDELDLANRLMDDELTVTEVNGLKVPSDAEVVMTARIKDEKSDEGPFVDLSRTWDKIRQQPVVEVNELYTRKDPLYRVLVPGRKEHAHLMGIPQEPRIYKIVKNTIPTVKNVVLTPGGCSWLHAVVQIDKRYEGDPKNAGMAALAAHPSLKKVTIVDSDIDPSNSNKVEWAVATRMQPDKDIVTIERSKGSSLDPSQDYENRLMSKWIVDATKPFGGESEEFKEVKIPGEDELELDDFR